MCPSPSGSAAGFTLPLQVLATEVAPPVVAGADGLAGGGTEGDSAGRPEAPAPLAPLAPLAPAAPLDDADVHADDNTHSATPVTASSPHALAGRAG